jgi:hypothetical protein
MPALGQSRHLDRRPITSGLPQQTDVTRVRQHVSNVPTLGHRTIPSITQSTVARSPARRLTPSASFPEVGLVRASSAWCRDNPNEKEPPEKRPWSTWVDRQALYVEAKLASVAADAEFVVYLFQQIDRAHRPRSPMSLACNGFQCAAQLF